MTVNYETDYSEWLAQTAKAVEEGRWDEIDRAKLAEELADLGRSEQRGIESQLRRIMIHALKILHQPWLHTRSWDLTIADARETLRRQFKENPSLEARAAELIADAYGRARIAAAKQTRLDLATFPERCPFTVVDVLCRDWDKETK